MRCEGGRVIGGWRPTVAREVAEAGPQRDDARQDRRQAALEAARRAHPLRAARVGYLGASDSPRPACALRRGCPPSAASSDTFMPDRRGDLMIDVPEPGRLQVLDRMYDEWCARGASMSRLQFPALQHGLPYRSPGSAEPVDRGEVVAWATPRRGGLGPPSLRRDGAVQGGRPQPAPEHPW